MEGALREEVSFQVELIEQWLHDQNIEVVVEYFCTLEVGHRPVAQGYDELLHGALPHDLGVFDQKAASRAIAEVLHPDARIRRHSVFLSEDAINYLGVRVGQVEHAGGKVTGQAELGNEDEKLEAERVADVDLRLACLPHLLGEHGVSEECTVTLHVIY